MRTYRGPRVDATILGAASLLALIVGSAGGATGATERFQVVPTPVVAVSGGAATYVGVWLSADDAVRLDVSTDGTYERSIVGRKQSARGQYRVDGTVLLLVDESGIRTAVTNSPGGIEMAGYQLARA